MQHISIVNGYVKSFLQIPSQTKQVTISQYDLTQEIKTLFYFQKILTLEKSKMVIDEIKKLEEDKESEEYKAYG